jgi:uncharacterized protein YndB with AHSA1/START domain
MSGNSLGDQCVVSMTVAVEPETAFAVFTQEIDQWWRRGPRFRNFAAGRGLIAMEAKPNGRVFESYNSEQGERVIEIGRILVWDAPSRLLFEWRGSNFSPNEHTQVEVLFTAIGTGTTVTVIHRGWAAIRPDHPVKHGLGSTEFIRMMGLWWGDQMSSFRQNVN